jgi:hypothetical protein
VISICAPPSIVHASEISSTTPLKTLNVHVSDVVTDRDAKTIPCEVTNAPAFLAALSRRDLVPWRNAVAGRAALHSHKGREGHVAGQRRVQADQFLGSVPAPGEFGYDLWSQFIALGPRVWLSLRTEQLDAVRQLGADALVPSRMRISVSGVM